MMIGERTAENIKIQVAAAYLDARQTHMEVRGRDLLTGLPKTIDITTAQASEALTLSVARIVDCVKKVLEDTPPELSADIMDRGIVLTGGGSMLYGLDQVIHRETNIPTMLADDPLSCVALGTGKALEFADHFEDGRTTNFSLRKMS